MILGVRPRCGIDAVRVEIMYSRGFERIFGPRNYVNIVLLTISLIG